ncbi:PREDICTED: RNA pseudouridylate synthase domain-containing protein 4-like isoform X1 [Acropora digitifera]|uniref:RNA pseudouridylate synthase domain-containing protein 4-like isoform X1 n=2 Tax=Acropora digitifera TaxID=70779 RepID=UPI00077AC378|nr:PREDICTED: RNA pseudouridylate synthase domain-containing protein 4-like isoform X1 [Acropora digitifera]
MNHDLFVPVEEDMSIAIKTARLALGKIAIDAHYLSRNVLFVNNDIIAVNKPYGLPVLSGPGVKMCITDMLDELTEIMKLQKKPQLAHRLDRDCSGTLLLTRTPTAAKKLTEMFSNRTVKKKYLAVTAGVPTYEEGEINIPIGGTKLTGGHRIVIGRELIGKSDEILKAEGFKNAKTRFEVLDANKTTCALLQLEPITGLKHQIRVHLAEGLKCPILGDHKFSSDIHQPQVLPLRLLQLLQIEGVKTKTNPEGRGKIRPWQRALIPLHLHARQLTLPQFDDGKDIDITAPIPEYFQETLQKLKLHPKRKNITMSREQAEYFKLKQLGKSTKKIVGF